jgi:hypothetical protein
MNNKKKGGVKNETAKSSQDDAKKKKGARNHRKFPLSVQMGHARMRDLHLEAVAAPLTTLTTDDLHSNGRERLKLKKRERKKMKK